MAVNLERGTVFTAFTVDIDKPCNTLVAKYGKEFLVPKLKKGIEKLCYH
jgi:hypothetical protein